MMLSTEVTVEVSDALFGPDAAVLEYLADHQVEAILDVRWEREDIERFHQHGSVVREAWEVRFWHPFRIILDGVALDHPSKVPSDFPMQEILKALESAEIAKMLRVAGVEARRA